MIGAMARAGSALEEPRYLGAATRAADFVAAHMERGGRLLRRWHSGSADIPGFLEDYALLSRGLLDLYEATGDPKQLAESLRLAKEMDRIFASKSGGYTFSGEGNEALLANPRDLDDGAMPSGNSVAAALLLRLGHLTGDTELETRGRAALETFGGVVAEAPRAFTEMLRAADFALGPLSEVVIAGKPEDPEAQRMLHEVRRRFLPRTVLAWHPAGPDADAAVKLIPYLGDQGAAQGKATAYVCRSYACQLPVHSAQELARLLDGLSVPQPAGRK
jgi:uncharacterized protein YyaL (SSP411 family)